MSEPSKPGGIGRARRKSEVAFLGVLLLLSLIVATMIFRFFWRPAIYAAVIGIGFYPVHLKIKKIIRWRNMAALVSTFLVLSIFILGAVFLVSAARGEIIRAAQHLNRNAAQNTGLIATLLHPTDHFIGWLDKYVDLESTGLTTAIESLPAKLSQLLLATATAMVAGLAGFLAQAAITLFILFFVFRDGASAARRLAALLPVDPRRMGRMYSQIRDNVFANLYGVLAVALTQGLLTGAAFAVLGVPSPVLFGIGAGLCSLIPIVGPAIVWVPGSIFLIATGHWLKGLFLLGWGGLVVGTADNVIRPLVIMGSVRFHPLILLFALVGGVEQFGFVGLFVGPVITSMVVALVEMLQQEISEAKSESAVPVNFPF